MRRATTKKLLKSLRSLSSLKRLNGLNKINHGREKKYTIDTPAKKINLVEYKAFLSRKILVAVCTDPILFVTPTKNVKFLLLYL